MPDQVRRCEVGCYGGGENSPTSNLDRLAGEGIRFNAALSTFPLSTPYRAMLQTGRMPAISGGIMNWINLPSAGRPIGPRRSALTMNFLSHWDFPETGTLWPEWRVLCDRQFTFVKWLNGPEEFYDNHAGPYQAINLFDGRRVPGAMGAARSRLREMLKEAHDNFRPGTAYAGWFDVQRNVMRNALGPV